MIDKGKWGVFGQDTRVTPLVFTRSAMGFLMTTECHNIIVTMKTGGFSCGKGEFITRSNTQRETNGAFRRQRGGASVGRRGAFRRQKRSFP